MSDSDGDSTNSVRLSSDISIELSNLVLVNLRQLWFDESLGINEILLEQRLLDYVEVLLVHPVVGQHLLGQLLLDGSESLRLFVLVESIIVLNAPYLADLGGVVLHVGVDHESCKCVIVVFVDLVLHNCQKVESGKDGSCQVYVVVEVEGHIVGTFQRICCCDNTASCLKTCNNSCF